MDEYLILLPDNEDAWEGLSDAEREAVYDLHREFARRLEEGGHTMTGGAELAPSRTAKTVRRVAGRPVISEGPPTDSAEQLSGFYLVETEDHDGLAEACGLLASHSPVEIRPVARHDAE
ncbi:YciI family protein [Arthrobacter sp. zg-Y1219]|uniref:YciI family protein n=1 Tax=Arthrobacter sp. zg-Y1219 TaxID=3049067 RepID=UPI0024C4069B|nr:YciI family protein [Arthrobacter sp. zg-Y1219]MDK1361872.1 YciI family protein [Arthrobacter sp. zg-Y1219]